MKDGDVIEFDYTLRIKGEGNVYDTTSRDVAEKAGIAHPRDQYTPMRYVVGAGRLITGMEDALRGAEVSKTLKLELSPEQGYGKRDPALVETVPLSEFRRQKVSPEPGMRLTWKNRRGAVTTVGGGRVRVDFNPPLAGRTLEYELTVRKVFKTPADRLVGLFLMSYPSSQDPSVKVDGTGADATATVELPDACKFDPNWVRAKWDFLTTARDHGNVAKVSLVETHTLSELPGGSEEKAASAESSD